MKFDFSIVIAGCLILAGCGPASVWDKNTKYTTDDFNKDKYACLKEGNQVFPISNQFRSGGYLSPYTVDVNEDGRDKYFIDCMNSKGWTLRPKTQ